jgi:hypothetical protein
MPPTASPPISKQGLLDSPSQYRRPLESSVSTRDSFQKKRQDFDFSVDCTETHQRLPSNSGLVELVSKVVLLISCFYLAATPLAERRDLITIARLLPCFGSPSHLPAARGHPLHANCSLLSD